MGYPIKITGLLAAGLMICATANAGHQSLAQDGEFFANASVTDVEPIVRIVQVSTPREVCWNETVQRTAYRRGHYRSHTPSVIGGILGGVVGNQFGSGRGQDVMTVAGALLGASIGRDAAYRNRHQAAPVYTTERRCEIEESFHEEERLDGYRVTYEFQGRSFTTRLPVDPGDTIRVRVQVDPAVY